MTRGELLDQLPDEALLPVHFVRSLLAELHLAEREPLADLTVKEVATALARRPSTVRAWLHAGELEGYKLRGREWRVSRPALRAFQAAAARGVEVEEDRESVPRDGQLSDWRDEYWPDDERPKRLRGKES